MALTSRKSTIAIVVAAAALTAPFAAFAERREHAAYVPATLMRSAQGDPSATFRVIIEGSDGTTTANVAEEVTKRLDDNKTRADKLTGRFHSVTGVAATLTGAQIAELSRDGDVSAITIDAPMVASQDASGSAAATVRWIDAARLDDARSATSGELPTIAVVDSGIDLPRRDFGSRVVGRVSLSQLLPNAFGDGRGHGTLVAGIAAGVYGAAPGAKVVALDVMDDHGKAMTSDVIAAADWILQNKARLNIRVANFSLHSSRPSSFRTDPLDRAVERLWFAGVVVVTSAGNYAVAGEASGVPFAPANDPFVITVGAADLGTTVSASDDSNAPWSAHGRTPDGFLKPDLGAPGRRLVGPVPVASTMAREHPERIAYPGYMRMSGTSFAAPVVAGAAAYVLAARPRWSPDQVKGALMRAADRAGAAAPGSLGVGSLDTRAAQLIADPPNPNLALNRFLIADPNGGPYPVFDGASWASAVNSDASWDSASWADGSWDSASWDSASWSDASWSDASWADASWADASWADASWADASWVD